MTIENMETTPVQRPDERLTRHLPGMKMPDVALPATDGTMVSLADSGLTVIYAYPRTSPPDGGAIEGWDGIPGARGCTPQSCAFRDHYAELRALGVQRLYGLSTQSTEYQQEVVNRLHLPFPLLSDDRLSLSRALKLPLFEAGGMTLIRRLTLIIDDGKVDYVFFPILHPEQNASDVAAWLARARKHY